jgi:cytoskeletal protein RodZ
MVGETLAAERRRQGKTIADVEAGTMIMGRMIDAIEHGRYESLPSPVYVKGYLQSYAKFLGLEERPILDAYKKETSQIDAEERLRLPDRAVVVGRDQLHAIPMRTWLIALGVVVALGLVLWAISGLTGSSDIPATIPPETSSTAETTDAPAPGESTDTSAAADSVVPTPADEGFTLTVTVDEGAASWLRVTVDGLNAYEGTLSGGGSKEWVVTDLATVLIGKPGSVSVTRDGVEVPIETADGRGSVTLSASGE